MTADSTDETMSDAAMTVGRGQPVYRQEQVRTRVTWVGLGTLGTQGWQEQRQGPKRHTQPPATRTTAPLLRTTPFPAGRLLP